MYKPKKKRKGHKDFNALRTSKKKKSNHAPSSEIIAVQCR